MFKDGGLKLEDALLLLPMMLGIVMLIITYVLGVR